MADIRYITGLAMRATEFTPLANLFRQLGHHMRGSDNLLVGDAPRFGAPFARIEDQAEHQWRQVDAEGQGKPLALLGYGMGAMIATAMAEQRPSDVERLILCATAVNSDALPALRPATRNLWATARTVSDFRACFRNLFGKTTLDKRPDVFERYVSYRMQGANGQSHAEFVGQMDSLTPYRAGEAAARLAKAGVPIFLIHGQEDVFFPPAHAQELHALTGAPVDWIAHAGHMLHLETPEVFSAAVHAAVSAPVPGRHGPGNGRPGKGKSVPRKS